MADSNWVNKQNLTPEDKLKLVTELSNDLFQTETDKLKFVPLATYADEANRLIQNWGKHQGFQTHIHAIDDLTYGMVKGELVILAGTPGVGKAKVLTTPVLTPNGFVPMADIKVGNLVYGQDGKPKKVLATKEWLYRSVYKITFSDSSTSQCDEQHLWKVQTIKQRFKNKDGKDRHFVLSTKEIIDNGWLKDNHSKYFIPIAQPVEHERKELPIEPYLLGVLLANGSLTSSRVDVTTNDAEIVARCSSRLPDTVYIKETTYESSTARHWIFRTEDGQPNPLARTIKSLGLDQLSHNKFIPNQYLFSSIEQRRELLAGLLDCDGSVRSDGNRGQPKYFSASENLAKGVQQLVQSLGGVASLHKYERDDAKSPEYVVSICTENNPFMLTRKRELFKPTRPVKAIRSITYVGRQTTKCIEVEDSLYLVDAYTVTHNSALIANIAINISKAGHLVGILNLEIKNGHLAGRIGKAYADWEKLPIIVQATAEDHIIATKDVVPAVRELAQQGCEVIIVDYLQMLALASDEEYKEVSNTVRALKSMAVSNNILVIAISSLNRSRDDGELTMKALHGSGKIEFFADIILFLQRDADNDQLFVKIVKNRNRKYDYKDDKRTLHFDGAVFTDSDPIMDIFPK